MSRPGTTLTRSETRPARSARTGTGPWFIAGITGTADTDALGVRKPAVSLTEYATRFGTRAQHITAGSAVMFDVADAYFREGGAELYVSRTIDALDPALTAALAAFTRDLGPGQVSAPGRTAAAQHALIMAHAATNNRIDVLDAPDTAVVATLTAAATVAGATAVQERQSSMFGPIQTIRSSSTGTEVEIPASAIVAGIMARNDGMGISPNQPSAGMYGQSWTSIKVKNSFSDADRTTLNTNGINLLIDKFDGVRVYGYRTLADPASAVESNWLQLSNARLFMAIQAELDAAAENFVFREIDGQGRAISEYGGVLTGVLLPWWQRGSLYGLTPEQAFRVDVGPNVNTEASIAAGELRAVIALKTSPFAEEVILELVKTKITETI